MAVILDVIPDECIYFSDYEQNLSEKLAGHIFYQFSYVRVFVMGPTYGATNTSAWNLWQGNNKTPSHTHTKMEAYCSWLRIGSCGTAKINVKWVTSRSKSCERAQRSASAFCRTDESWTFRKPPITNFLGCPRTIIMVAKTQLH